MLISQPTKAHHLPDNFRGSLGRPRGSGQARRHPAEMVCGARCAFAATSTVPNSRQRRSTGRDRAGAQTAYLRDAFPSPRHDVLRHAIRTCTRNSTPQNAMPIHSTLWRYCEGRLPISPAISRSTAKIQPTIRHKRFNLSGMRKPRF